MTSTLFSLPAFEIRPLKSPWNDIPGVYMFCGVSAATQKWDVFYVGQASSLRDRLSAHERWAEAALVGATHVHAVVVRGELQRDQLEFDLIQRFNPPLNKQLRSPTSGAQAGLLGSIMFR